MHTHTLARLDYKSHSIGKPQAERRSSIATFTAGKPITITVFDITQALGKGSFGCVRDTDNEDIIIKMLTPTFSILNRDTGFLELDARIFDAKYIQTSFEQIEKSAPREANFNFRIHGIGAHFATKDPIVMHFEAGKNKWIVTSWPHHYIGIKRLKGSHLSSESKPGNQDYYLYKLNSEERFSNFMLAACRSLKPIHDKNIVLEDIHDGNLLLEVDSKSDSVTVNLIDHTITQDAGTRFLIGSLDLKMKPPEFKDQKEIAAEKPHDIYCLGLVFQRVYKELTTEKFKFHPSYTADVESFVNTMLQDAKHVAQRPTVEKCIDQIQLLHTKHQARKKIISKLEEIKNSATGKAVNSKEYYHWCFCFYQLDRIEKENLTGETLSNITLNVDCTDSEIALRIKALIKNPIKFSELINLLPKEYFALIVDLLEIKNLFHTRADVNKFSAQIDEKAAQALCRQVFIKKGKEWSDESKDEKSSPEVMDKMFYCLSKGASKQEVTFEDFSRLYVNPWKVGVGLNEYIASCISDIDSLIKLLNSFLCSSTAHKFHLSQLNFLLSQGTTELKKLFKKGSDLIKIINETSPLTVPLVINSLGTDFIQELNFSFERDFNSDVKAFEEFTSKAKPYLGSPCPIKLKLLAQTDYIQAEYKVDQNRLVTYMGGFYYERIIKEVPPEKFKEWHQWYFKAKKSLYEADAKEFPVDEWCYCVRVLHELEKDLNISVDRMNACVHALANPPFPEKFKGLKRLREGAAKDSEGLISTIKQMPPGKRFLLLKHFGKEILETYNPKQQTFLNICSLLNSEEAVSFIRLLGIKYIESLELNISQLQPWNFQYYPWFKNAFGEDNFRPVFRSLIKSALQLAALHAEDKNLINNLYQNLADIQQTLRSFKEEREKIEFLQQLFKIKKECLIPVKDEKPDFKHIGSEKVDLSNDHLLFVDTILFLLADSKNLNKVFELMNEYYSGPISTLGIKYYAVHQLQSESDFTEIFSKLSPAQFKTICNSELRDNIHFVRAFQKFSPNEIESQFPNEENFGNKLSLSKDESIKKEWCDIYFKNLQKKFQTLLDEKDHVDSWDQWCYVTRFLHELEIKKDNPLARVQTGFCRLNTIPWESPIGRTRLRGNLTSFSVLLKIIQQMPGPHRFRLLEYLGINWVTNLKPTPGDFLTLLKEIAPNQGALIASLGVKSLLEVVNSKNTMNKEFFEFVILLFNNFEDNAVRTGLQKVISSKELITLLKQLTDDNKKLLLEWLGTNFLMNLDFNFAHTFNSDINEFLEFATLIEKVLGKPVRKQLTNKMMSQTDFVLSSYTKDPQSIATTVITKTDCEAHLQKLSDSQQKIWYTLYFRSKKSVLEAQWDEKFSAEVVDRWCYAERFITQLEQNEKNILASSQVGLSKILDQKWENHGAARFIEHSAQNGKEFQKKLIILKDPKKVELIEHLGSDKLKTIIKDLPNLIDAIKNLNPEIRKTLLLTLGKNHLSSFSALSSDPVTNRLFIDEMILAFGKDECNEVLRQLARSPSLFKILMTVNPELVNSLFIDEKLYASYEEKIPATDKRAWHEIFLATKKQRLQDQLDEKASENTLLDQWLYSAVQLECLRSSVDPHFSKSSIELVRKDWPPRKGVANLDAKHLTIPSIIKIVAPLKKPLAIIEYLELSEKITSLDELDKILLMLEPKDRINFIVGLGRIKINSLINTSDKLFYLIKNFSQNAVELLKAIGIDHLRSLNYSQLSKANMDDYFTQLQRAFPGSAKQVIVKVLANPKTFYRLNEGDLEKASQKADCKEILPEIDEIIQPSPEILTLNFGEMTNPILQKHYLVELLKASNVNSLIDKLSVNNLHVIKEALNKNKNFFDQFKWERVLLRIDEKIEADNREKDHDQLINLLSLIKKIISTRQLIPTRRYSASYLLCCLFQPGSAICVDGSKIFVPSRAYGMYQALTQYNLQHISFQDGDVLLQKIQALANEALNDTMERHPDTNFFYRSINEMQTPLSLLQILQDRFNPSLMDRVADNPRQPLIARNISY